MKHIIVILIQLLMAGLLCSCIGQTSENQPLDSGESVASAEPSVSIEPEVTQMPITEIETVSLYGQSVYVDTEELTIDKPIDSFADLNAMLPKLSSLRSLQFILPLSFSENGVALEEEFHELCLQNPAIDISAVWLLEGAAPESVSSYTAKPEDESTGENLVRMITKLPNVNILDLNAITPSREAISALVQTSPDVQVLWTDPVFGASDSQTEILSCSVSSADDLNSYLTCFCRLTEVDLSEADIPEAEADMLCCSFPGISFRRTVTLNGIPVDSFVEELNMDGAEISDYDTFSKTLQFFPRLKRIELNECSLSNEQLGSIAERYSNIKVVWTVHIRKMTIRTDAVAFSTQQPGYNKNRLSSKDVSSLQYCTDLIALDLGHNDLTDLEFLRPLQNLQVLILVDSHNLKDISVLGSLKKLKYIELFMTSITDISPLADLPDLLDINLCITRVVDPTPLLSCKNLERIWIGHQTQAYMDAEKLHALIEAFPNAEYDITSVSCTNLGWREHPRFYAFRSMFQTNEPVEPFLP